MDKKIIFLGVIGITVSAFFILINGVLTYEVITYPDYAVAATSSVTVSASILATISCSTDQSSTSFGTLTSSVVATSTPNASTTMSCAISSAGCTLYVKDEGSGSNSGLWNSTSSKLIASVSSTLVAGTEGYGINATTTAAGSGGTFTIGTQYRLGSDVSTSTIGGLSRTNVSLATTNSTSSSREVVVRHKAAIAASTPAGTYNDTITYECTAN